MEKIRKTHHILVAHAFIFLSGIANASRTLDCTINESQGKARIEVLPVTGDPLLKVFKIELVTKLQRPTANFESSRKMADLKGSLTAQLDTKGRVFASGLVVNSGTKDSIIIDPTNITLNGEIKPNGEYVLTLYDSSRVIQLGYGVSIVCR